MICVELSGDRAWGFRVLNLLEVMTLLAAYVDIVPALKYGYNCFNRTSTSATLSSFYMFSMGVSRLGIKKNK